MTTADKKKPRKKPVNKTGHFGRTKIAILIDYMKVNTDTWLDINDAANIMGVHPETARLYLQRLQGLSMTDNKLRPSDYKCAQPTFVYKWRVNNDN